MFVSHLYVLFLIFYFVFLSKFCLYIYLFLAELGLRCCTGFSLLGGESRLLSSCGVKASHCGGFSSCAAWAVECMGFSSCRLMGRKAQSQ